jgi:hypothetical protein
VHASKTCYLCSVKSWRPHLWHSSIDLGAVDAFNTRVSHNFPYHAAVTATNLSESRQSLPRLLKWRELTTSTRRKGPFSAHSGR